MMPEGIPEEISKRIPRRILKRIPEWTLKETPEVYSEKIDEEIPEDINKGIPGYPDGMPITISERMLLLTGFQNELLQVPLKESQEKSPPNSGKINETIPKRMSKVNSWEIFEGIPGKRQNKCMKESLEK